MALTTILRSENNFYLKLSVLIRFSAKLKLPWQMAAISNIQSESLSRRHREHRQICGGFERFTSMEKIAFKNQYNESGTLDSQFTLFKIIIS